MVCHEDIVDVIIQIKLRLNSLNYIEELTKAIFRGITSKKKRGEEGRRKGDDKTMNDILKMPKPKCMLFLCFQ